MKIKKILSQTRRDFTATLDCEHCGHEQKLSGGYDDDNYHKNVIPQIKCKKCDQKAPEDFRPLQPKYADREVI
jgi:transcription elongation factor Elf1